MASNTNYLKTDLTADDYELICRMKLAADEVHDYHFQLSINYIAPDSEQHADLSKELAERVLMLLELSENELPLALYFIANVLKQILEELKSEGISQQSWLTMAVIETLYEREKIIEQLQYKTDREFGYVMGVFVCENDPSAESLAAAFQGASGEVVGADFEYNILSSSEDLFGSEIDHLKHGKAIVGYIVEAHASLENLTLDDLLP